MRVFLDTNVILDTILPGRPNEAVSERVVNIGNVDSLRFSVSTLSLANTAYMARKILSPRGLRELLDELRHRWRVLSLNEYNIYDALKSECPDFEDAMQISIAEGDCDVIVTNNVKHFKGFTALEVCTPQEFLDRVLI